MNSLTSFLPTTRSLSELIILNDLQVNKEKAVLRKIRILSATSIFATIGGLGFVARGATLQESSDNALKSQLFIVAGLVMTIAGLISLFYLKKFSKQSTAPSLIGRVLDVQTSHVDKVKLLITMTSICKFIEQHQVEWKQYVQSTKESLYIPSSKILSRTIQYNTDHTIFIHFNQKKNSDLCIGKGSFKTVTLALNFFTCEWMASASVELTNAKLEIIAYQLTQQHQLRHVIQTQYMINYDAMKISANGINETIKKVRFISPYYIKKDLKHSINNNLRSGPPLTWPEKIKITRQLIEGVTNIHEIGWLHRDLKPGNIFLGDNEACIGDLGSICRINDITGKMNRHTTTLGYASPEYFLAHKILETIYIELNLAYEDHNKCKRKFDDCINEYQKLLSNPLQDSSLLDSSLNTVNEAQKLYKTAHMAYHELVEKKDLAKETFVGSVTEKLDVWSLGCVLYELHSPHGLPWDNIKTPDDLFNAFISLRDGWVPEFQDSSLTSLISKMLCVDPKKRLSSRELREMLTTLPILQLN